jgi:hypothetical protein
MKIGKRIVTFDIAARKRTCRNHLPGDEVAPHVILSGCKAIDRNQRRESTNPVDALDRGFSGMVIRLEDARPTYRA